MIASISYEFIIIDCICLTNVSLFIGNLCCFIIDHRNACGINLTSMQYGNSKFPHLSFSWSLLNCIPK